MGVRQARQALTELGVPESSVYVDGTWLRPDVPQIEVVDPFDEAVIGLVPESGAQIAASAVAAAVHAFPEWSSLAPAARADLVERLAEALESVTDALAVLASCEIGMPVRDSRGGQVALPAAVTRTYASLARTLEWEHRDESGTTVTLEAAGPVLAITPWNFPVHQIMAKLAPALVAGCTVVLKPSELTPFNALAIAHLTHTIGFPAGVVNVVTGTGPVTGEALLQADGWEVVSFTGSLGVGRHIGAVAGERIARATLELGGKSPAVVLPDAPLEEAVAATVRNCFVNAGQKCNAPTRLYVPEPERERLVKVAVSAASAYVAGDPLDAETTLGPMVSAAQRERVRGFLERAAADGATLHPATVDLPTEGFFQTPTIVTDVSDDAEIAREEVFGPVLTVLGYTDVDEALERANDSQYGLSAEVWAGNEAEAAAVARRLRAGQVRVNGQRTPMPPVSPFGGFRRSGLGRELGRHGLDEYLEARSILGDPASPSDPRTHPTQAR
ncbi:aldehyde dehydrogenase family protein [Kribbia dieselivorans]|uniref:aldehyde dehydrogenase family protein n=1 Tax=Kribbia dieselivorans TaxID=331526 RepID=UPI0008382E86|nr:aldehyde dehydrogenase family protein [Kribbia dieselivorans]